MVKDSENAPNACITTEAPHLARQPREVPLLPYDPERALKEGKMK